MSMTTLIPTDLRCEYLVEPLGIDAPRPRLTWVLEVTDPARRGVRQTAYQVVVTDGAGGLVWDSGRIASDQTVNIEYGGEPLGSGRRYRWKVKVWDERAVASEWSQPASWTMGLLRPSDWRAKWIGAPVGAPWLETQSQPSLMLRKTFTVAGAAKRAVVYVSALGLYELRFNGRRAGDQMLAPEWTDYRKRVQYQTYDVTALLHTGENAVGAMLGQGWYAGRIGLSGWHNGGGLRGFYGRHLRLIAQLEIELADGKKQVVLSDETWRCTMEGPLRGADILDGETYDARRELAGWHAPGFNDASWRPVGVSVGPRLFAQPNEPIRITRQLPTVAMTEPQPGVFVFDLGQNMVGWCRLKVRGAAGADIRLRYAEVLNPDGTIYRDNLRIAVTPLGAGQEDHYICRGDGAEIFEPRFTYHGFRYVEVAGLRNRPALDDLVGCVVHSAAPEAGKFECSSPLLNKIMAAIQWTQRGNLHSIPTDCPQRDERLGWMGDIQVFSQTACFNMDMAAFFTKWLRDVRDAQADDGRFPDFAPHPFDPNARFSGNPGWADAGVIVPWCAYVNYGDQRLLEENFDSARRWIEFVHDHTPDLIRRIDQDLGMISGMTYGDWLNGDTLVGLPDWPKAGGEVPKDVYATAFFAYSTQLLARTAEVIGRDNEARHYSGLARDIRAAFNREFVSPDGRIRGDTQAGYALALHFDLLPEKLRPLAVRHMVAALQPYHGGMSTGIQSTVRMMLELSRHGCHEQAYALMTRRTMPSWGYMVEHGGTTIWERWDGWVEGRGFQSPGMNSFNHYALGAVGEWMWRVIVGINPDNNEPGYRHFIIRPIPGGGLTWARGQYRSIRGTIQVAWRLDGLNFSLDVVVPCNTTATAYLPGEKAEPRRIGSGAYHLETTCEDRP